MLPQDVFTSLLEQLANEHEREVTETARLCARVEELETRLALEATLRSESTVRTMAAGKGESTADQSTVMPLRDLASVGGSEESNGHGIGGNGFQSRSPGRTPPRTSSPASLVVARISQQGNARDSFCKAREDVCLGEAPDAHPAGRSPSKEQEWLGKEATQVDDCLPGMPMNEAMLKTPMGDETKRRVSSSSMASQKDGPAHTSFGLRSNYQENYSRRGPVRSLSFVRKRLNESQTAEEGLLTVQTYEGFMRHFISFPQSTLRTAWDIMGIFLIGWDIIFIPLRAFAVPASAFMEWTTLIFWTINMPMSMTVGYVHDGKVIMHPRKILKHYLKTWFLVDVIVVLPDWVFTISSLVNAPDNEDADQLKLLRVLRFIRTVRLIRLMKLQVLLSHMNDLLDSEYASISFNIIKMIMSLLMINHFIACIWFSLSTIEQEDGYTSWVDFHGFTEAPWGYMYTTAFHWSITQFTPASMHVQPQNMAERTFAICIVVFALVVFSYLVGSITGSLTQLRSIQEEASKQFWNLRRYLRQHQVSISLSLRINKYVEHAWQQQKLRVNKSSVKIFSLLSEQLDKELQAEMSVPHVSVHPLFHHLNCISNITMLRLASTSMHRKPLARGDSLFYPGETATHMYFVVFGRLQYHKSEVYKEQVDKGEDWIAEPVMWTPTWVHLGLLTADSECELLLVDPKNFGDQVRLNPVVFNVVCCYGRNFLKWLNEDKLRGGEAHDRLSDITQGEDESDFLRAMIDNNASNPSYFSRGSTGSSSFSPEKAQSARSGGSALSRRQRGRLATWGQELMKNTIKSAP